MSDKAKNNIIKLNPQTGDKFIPKTTIKEFEDLKDKVWEVIKIGTTARDYIPSRRKLPKNYYVGQCGNVRSVFLDRDIKEWI